MPKFNQSVAPYYNIRDNKEQYPHYSQYTQLLAVPGRVAQARELTEIQSTVKDIVKSLGDSILKDGNVIEGCQVIVNDDKSTVTVTAGRVYLNGMVLPVEETTIGITGKGTEIIGFKLIETLITENEDITLRDPAQGYDNFNQAGCHRIKSEVSVIKVGENDSDYAILTTLADGAVTVEKYAPEYDVLTQTLARRTYDESGSYIVEGLTVRVEDNITNSNKVNVVIESGKAYVLGYELKIPAPRRIEIDRALTTEQPINPATGLYRTGINSYKIHDDPYISSIKQVTGYKSHVENLGAPATNTAEIPLEKSTIETQQQYDGKYTYHIEGYEAGVDYEIYPEGNYCFLVWKGTNNYPTSSYNVSYRYIHTFESGVDYELHHNESDNSHEIKWISSNTPLVGTTFTVVYEQYLARKDVVYIDQYGDISVVQGTPAQYNFELTPGAPVNTLTLATISSPPGGNNSNNSKLKIITSNVGLTRFTMNDIQKILNRIKTLEYDQTILSLNDEARQYETTSEKRGIFTDPLIDFSKIDYTYNLEDGVAVDPTLPIYDATIDTDSNMSYLPVNTRAYDATPSNLSTANISGRTATLAVTGESVVLSQLYATKSFLVNPYTTFPQLPEISITPAVDTWIDETLITVPVSRSTTEVIQASTRHISNWGRASGSSTTDTAIGQRVDTFSEESIVAESSIKYIRRREIEVDGSLFPPNLENIKCYFDGVEVPLIATGDTEAGEGGSVKSNESGAFTAKFTIPENILTGIREVRLSSDVKVDGYETSAFALYQASGTSRTIQRTVTTLTTVLLNRVTTVNTIVSPIDPVGQTFVLDRMTLVSGIDLYFESKPTGNVPITCDIREVINGNITSTVYGHSTLPADSVLISSDSSVATRFKFDTPVLLEENKEYAFVVRSTSPNYRLWVAELGSSDILSGNLVLSNPYLIGVMMSSSNNSSWTTHQTMDIKFRLVENTYSNTSDIYFGSITSEEEFGRIYLLAESAILEGTTVTWYYSVDDGVTYREISPYDILVLNQTAETINIKATLAKSVRPNLSLTHLSPIVALDTIGVVLSSYDTLGWYITDKVPGIDPYTNVDVVIDTYNTNNTSMEVYVASVEKPTADDLIKATINKSSDLNYGWKQLTYKATVPDLGQDTDYYLRVYIKMGSTLKYETPAFRRLRVIMS